VIKVAVPVVMGAAVLGLCIWLFRGETIHWLSPVKPLATLMVATPLAFGFTYFAEDRQRRFMLKALSKVVSPAVAEQLSREPERLALGTVRTEITVLFTDLANFTDLSEGPDVQDLGKLINRYLGEMSTEVFKQDGTLDKYIGDAVMAFWNAPLTQADHAARACRAALGMVRREKELHGEFAALGTKHIFTRIGINTTSVAVGFIGSEHLFNYTAMGDGVNLASRMEGANKLYGTQILISETTAALVREKFNMRRIDVLRVKGKKKPMGVFELLGEGAVDQGLGERIRGYEEAFDAYQARNWERAEKLLLEVCGRFGEDGAAEALLKRVREYRNDPPAADWDGVFVSDTK
jgi:adenylate cyclase